MIKAIMIGRLTADPKVKESKDGVKYSIYSLACDNTYGKGDTLFVECVSFGGVSDLVSNHCHKGDRVYAEGLLEPNEYNSKDGSRVKTFTAKVNQVQLLEYKKDK